MDVAAVAGWCCGRAGGAVCGSARFCPAPLLYPLPLPRLSSRPVSPGAGQLTLLEGGSFIQEN